MSISQTPFLPDVLSDDPIPHSRLAYLQERTRNLLFEYVLEKFLRAEKDGLTKAKLARRIHRRPEIVTRLLGAPGNWEISTLSDLLAGISNEELQPSSIVVDADVRPNHDRPEWLAEKPFWKVESTGERSGRIQLLRGLADA